MRTHREPLHLVDAQLDEGFSARQSVVLHGLRTILAVPVDGPRPGVLYADARRVLERAPAGLAALAALAGLFGAWLAGPVAAAERDRARDLGSPG